MAAQQRSAAADGGVVTTFAQQNVTVELAYDAAPLTDPNTQAVAWTDVTADVRSVTTRRGRSNELDTVTTGTATVVLNNLDRTYDPGTPGTAVFGAYFPGTINDNIYAADGLSAGVTTLDIRCVVAPDQWKVPWRPQVLVTQGDDSAVAVPFAFGLCSTNMTGYNTGGLFLETTVSGGTTTGYSATADVPADDGEIYCVRATWRSSDGRIQFFTKATTLAGYAADCTANTGWAQLGADDVGETAALDDSDDPVRFGTYFYPGYNFQGIAYYMEISETIDGAPVMSFDIADYSSGESFSSGGDTWTIDSRPPTSNGTQNLGLTVRVGTVALTALHPRMPIRVSSTISATTRRIFTGQVQRITQGYTPGGDAIVTLECADAFALLAAIELPESHMTTESLDTLGLYEEPPDFGFNLNTAGRYHYSYTRNTFTPNKVLESFGTISAGEQIVPYGPETSVYFNGNLGLGFGAADGTADTTGTISVWFRTSTAGAVFQPRILFASPARAGGSAPYIGIDENGYVKFVTSAGNTGTVQVNVADGNVHHLVVINEGGRKKVFIDGRGLYNETGKTGHFLDSENNWAIGAAWNWVPLALGFVGEISMFTHWWSYITEQQAVDLYNAGTYGSAGDTTDVRLGQILDVAGWPTTRRDIDTGYGVCGGDRFNDTALAAIRTIGNTEQGLIFIAKDGDLTMRSRYWQTTDTTGSTSQATFSDDNAVGAIAFRTMSLGVDAETTLRNDVTVNGNDSGISSRYRDDASIYAYGVARETISTCLLSSDLCVSMARAIVERWKDPVTRVPPFTIRPTTAANLATILALELGDRITVEVTPPGGGSQYAYAMVVDSIAHNITQSQVWDVTLAGSPVDPNTYFVLDVSELDSTHVIGY